MPQGVVVNLVFDSEETRELGISGHVCELQLVTRDFAAIMQVLGDSNSRLDNGAPAFKHADNDPSERSCVEVEASSDNRANYYQVPGDSKSRLENDFPSSSTLITITVSAHAQRLPQQLRPSIAEPSF